MNTKKLIAYFTYTGHTKGIAEQIQEIAGGTIFEIRPAEPYSEDYDTCEAKAKKEIKDKYHPALAENVDNLDQYDTIFIGTPNWFNKVASPVATFLSENNFAGKTIVPFCTNGGDGARRVASDISQYVNGVRILEYLDIYEDGGSNASAKIKSWLSQNGL